MLLSSMYRWLEKLPPRKPFRSDEMRWSTNMGSGWHESSDAKAWKLIMLDDASLFSEIRWIWATVQKGSAGSASLQGLPKCRKWSLRTQLSIKFVSIQLNQTD